MFYIEHLSIGITFYDTKLKIVVHGGEVLGHIFYIFYTYKKKTLYMINNV